MDRYSILLKKNPSYPFREEMKKVFGTKYPLQIVSVMTREIIFPFQEAFLFYDPDNEMFSLQKGKTLPFFQYGEHRDQLKISFRALSMHENSFRALSVHNNIKSILIYRRPDLSMGVVLYLDQHRMVKQRESDLADYEARPGYGRSEG